MDKGKRKDGFTLIELLIAMLIIGILMSLLIPAVGKIMENARRMRGANCLKQIATAYSQYCNDDVNGRKINLVDDPTGKKWAEELAKGGYLTDPSAYCFSNDDGALKISKKSIVDAAGKPLTDVWKTESDKDFSVWLINNVPMDAPLTTTPIAFTRGLPSEENDTAGSDKVAKWPPDGVYGTKGGYIAFLDGHVEWFDDLGGDSTGKLLKWNGGDSEEDSSTNKIQDTIPETATILKANAAGTTETGGKEESGD